MTQVSGLTLGPGRVLNVLESIGGVFDTKTARIKSRYNDHELARTILTHHGASRLGLDHQVDTYFDVPNAVFKLKEGDLENFLIYITPLNGMCYNIFFNPLPKGSKVRDYIPKELNELVVVYKDREIFEIDGVRFNLDDVKGLGKFVSIDVRDISGKMTYVGMLEKLLMYSEIMKVNIDDCTTLSYGSLMLAKNWS